MRRPKPPAAYKRRWPTGATARPPAKVSGAAFIHDMVRPDMLHARILRQPARGATLASLDEAAVRRAAGGDFRVVRVGNFVAFVGDDETVVQRAAAAAPAHAKWDNVPRLTPAMQEAAWLIDATIGRSLLWRSEAGDSNDRRRRYSDLFAAIRRACRDGAVLRAGGSSRRASVSLVAHPGRLSVAQCAGERAGHVAGRDHRASRAWRRLLWP